MGDSGDVLKGTHRTLNALKGTLKTSGHVPKAPLTSHTKPAPPTSAPPAKRASPAEPRPPNRGRRTAAAEPRPPNRGRRTAAAGPRPPDLADGQTPGKITGGFRFNALRGTLKTFNALKGTLKTSAHVAELRGWGRVETQ